MRAPTEPTAPGAPRPTPAPALQLTRALLPFLGRLVDDRMQITPGISQINGLLATCQFT
jgi:hypothetical protein